MKQEISLYVFDTFIGFCLKYRFFILKNVSSYFAFYWPLPQYCGGLFLTHLMFNPFMYGRFYPVCVKRFLYVHIAYASIQMKNFSQRVLDLKKASKFNLFQKFQKQNLPFWIFSNNFVSKQLHAPFLPYLDTQHSICDFFTSHCLWVP